MCIVSWGARAEPRCGRYARRRHGAVNSAPASGVALCSGAGRGRANESFVKRVGNQQVASRSGGWQVTYTHPSIPLKEALPKEHAAGPQEDGGGLIPLLTYEYEYILAGPSCVRHPAGCPGPWRVNAGSSRVRFNPPSPYPPLDAARKATRTQQARAGGRAKTLSRDTGTSPRASSANNRDSRCLG